MDAQTLALFVAGIVAPFLINFIKARLGLESKAALALAYGSSVVIAFAAVALTGGFGGFTGGDLPMLADFVLVKASAVFGLATLIYKFFLSRV